MSPFVFVLILILGPVAIVAGTVLLLVSRKPSRSQKQERLIGEQFAKINSRLDKMETRMSNIETIVIDRDKQDPYDALND